MIDAESIAILSAGLESGSTRIATSFEELCLDVMVVLRTMLEEGTPEDRVSVAKLIGPLMAKANAKGDDVTAGDGGASVAREILAEMWNPATGSDP